MKATFEPGKRYYARSICDYVFRAEIHRRTAKTVVVSVDHYPDVKQKRRKIHHNDEGEFSYPFGQYSMWAEVIRAKKREDNL